MARYIDVDKFAAKICNFQAIDEDAANKMVWLLRTFPTADVVPKSEVENIFAELERLVKETMRADEKCMDDNSILEWRLCCLKDFLYWLAELKKKHTEGN